MTGMDFFWYAVAGALLVVLASLIRRQRQFEDCCVALGMVVLVVMISIPQYLTAVLHPHTMDGLLLRVDSALHLDPVAVARLVYELPWLHRMLFVAYCAIPFFLCVVYTIEHPPALIRAALLGSIAAFFFYNLIPAVGPAHAMPHFPFGGSEFLAFVPIAPRNCFPSMHFGWALLAAWNVRGRRLKVAAWIFTGLTAFATIGIGEHYFIDLIVAVPFCWAVQKVAVMELTRARSGSYVSTAGTASADDIS